MPSRTMSATKSAKTWSQAHENSVRCTSLCFLAKCVKKQEDETRKVEIEKHRITGKLISSKRFCKDKCKCSSDDLSVYKMDIIIWQLNKIWSTDISLQMYVTSLETFVLIALRKSVYILNSTQTFSIENWIIKDLWTKSESFPHTIFSNVVHLIWRQRNV